MADFELVMPKMGESVQEATITKWMVKAGDIIEEDDALVEIATDKVDTEIPSPVSGKVLKLFFTEGSLVPVGKIIALINTEGKGEISTDIPVGPYEKTKENQAQVTDINTDAAELTDRETTEATAKSTGRFYSPLVLSIARKENISNNELDSIAGSGLNGRVRKQDILAYLDSRDKGQMAESSINSGKQTVVKISIDKGDKIVEMDRMRKLIADHMLKSKQISPHVTNFIEADVTNLVLWRNKIKDGFYKKEKQKLTFMPMFIEAAARALKEFPGVNSSVEGNNIILRKNVNIGIAVALQSGNLIVPVIKNADQKSLLGLTFELNKLADAARNNNLSPDDIQGGTFTISNFGTFRNLTGTPIINQPQSAILATGTVEKKPAVIETPAGDAIAIRHKMILSLSYDHRIIDGALGGAFLRFLADLLEGFDIKRTI